MAIQRVTQRALITRVLTNISDHQQNLLVLQDQLATGYRVNRPSEAPLAARRAVDGRLEVARLEQYRTNISTVGPTMTETSTSLLSAVDILQRAVELTLRGKSTTNAQEQRDLIAEEVNQLLESMLSEANHETNGRYLFAGTRTTAPPFEATRDANGDITAVAYAGNDESIQVEISAGVFVAVNMSGQDAFVGGTPTTVNLLDTLIQVRDNLLAGDVNALDTRLEELYTGQDQLLRASARVGAAENRLSRADDTLQTILTQLEEVISDNIDADFADVTVELNAESNAFQASLSAAARVIQPSLLDFLG